MTDTITYKKNNIISFEDLMSLYQSVEWTGYTNHPKKMRSILDGSYYYLSAWKQNKLVGLIRAVGDGVSILYIQDILVHPAYQRLGIGSALMKQLIEDNSDIRQMVLMTDDTNKTKAFYQVVGFQSVEQVDGKAFVRYDFTN